MDMWVITKPQITHEPPFTFAFFKSNSLVYNCSIGSKGIVRLYLSKNEKGAMVTVNG